MRPEYKQQMCRQPEADSNRQSAPAIGTGDRRGRLAQLLIKQGTHPAVIAARLGHVSAKTVLDVYGHLFEGPNRNAADTLEPPRSDSDVPGMRTRT